MMGTQQRIGSQERLEEQSGALQDLDALDMVLSAVPSLVMITDPERRIVYANRAVLDFLGTSASDVVGKAPGEALGCTHALEDGASCGSTPHCAYCGANRALQEAWQGAQSVQECRISRINEVTPPALDLRIWATPLMLDGDCYVVIAAADISDEKRRQALERIFFHDVLNTATIIDGAAKLLQSMGPDEDTEHVKKLLTQVTERLIDEIVRQRDFVELETQQVTPKASEVRPKSFLQGLVDSYLSHDAARELHIEIEPGVPEATFEVDKALLGRVLGNLLKNAIEASEPGETITLGSRMVGDAWIEFWVHNDQVMSEDVRMQVFKRSFSTKGRGRGLGTYGARLLTERYLEGEIAFTSEPGEGTAFYVRYPLAPTYADGG